MNAYTEGVARVAARNATINAVRPEVDRLDLNALIELSAQLIEELVGLDRVDCTTRNVAIWTAARSRRVELLNEVNLLAAMRETSENLPALCEVPQDELRRALRDVHDKGGLLRDGDVRDGDVIDPVPDAATLKRVQARLRADA